MGRALVYGNPPIKVTLRRSARARRISLRVSRLDGRVTLTLPQRTTDRAGLDFVAQKERWLRDHLADMTPPQAVCAGGTLPFEGRDVVMRTGNVRRLTLDGDTIWLPRDGVPGPRVKAFLQTRARDALVAASDHYAAQVGRTYSGISLRDTRSRWGSCSSRGGLMYSWRLVMAPPQVLHYVAAHEVAHLVEMNHAPAFWAVVDRLMPDFERHRIWLRDHGESLHRIRFDTDAGDR